MKVLSKSLAAMVAAATLVGGGAFAVAGTAYAADNDAITVTPNDNARFFAHFRIPGLT